jgi:hypothetical protein
MPHGVEVFESTFVTIFFLGYFDHD